MTRLKRGCLVVATGAGMLILPAAATAANPAPGARFTIHHHEIKGAGWHVQIDFSRRHAGVVHSLELYDERCEETIGADRIRLAPDGTLDTSADFIATDRRGGEQPGHWALHAQFPAGDRVEGSFSVTEPKCEAVHPFAGVRDVPGGGHHHGKSDPFDYPDIAGATPGARARARRMLRRVRAVAARRFSTIERARAEGFSRYMIKEKVPEPGVFHLWSRAYNEDSSVLDPERPESLVYWKPSRPGARRVLLGFMFRLRPGPPPEFAGTIPSWHSHKKGGDQMTHVWLARSLRGAYANCLAVPELERSLHAFKFEDVRYDGDESQPCAQDSG